MTFQNEKKTFLRKLDKSKKGKIDRRVIKLIKTINQNPNYYTTSSCSGRVILWKGTGKKDETEWLKVSHDKIGLDFFESLERETRLVWLRLEPFIIHIACRDLASANQLLDLAKTIYKKSNLLSITNKIIIEIKGSEFLEMPFGKDSKQLFSGNINWLNQLINSKLDTIWENTEKFRKKIKNYFLSNKITPNTKATSTKKNNTPSKAT